MLQRPAGAPEPTLRPYHRADAMRKRGGEGRIRLPPELAAMARNAAKEFLKLRSARI